MTDIIRKNIKGKCPQCGTEGEIDLYGSVNVTADPELLEAVKNRKINSFHCEKCGFKNEIIMPFLYHDMHFYPLDMNKTLMVYVYPEGYEGPEIDEGSQKTKTTEIIKDFMARKILFKVYGFDELFKLIEEKKEEQREK